MTINVHRKLSAALDTSCDKRTKTLGSSEDVKNNKKNDPKVAIDLSPTWNQPMWAEHIHLNDENQRGDQSWRTSATATSSPSST
jgi:hypothetical protein